MGFLLLIAKVCPSVLPSFSRQRKSEWKTREFREMAVPQRTRWTKNLFVMLCGCYGQLWYFILGTDGERSEKDIVTWDPTHTHAPKDIRLKKKVHCWFDSVFCSGQICIVCTVFSTLLFSWCQARPCIAFRNWRARCMTENKCLSNGWML